MDVYLGSDGCRYVRVIDYKTGHKSFRLPDVLLGLNMQMLVYLAAPGGKRPGAACRGALHARGRALGLGGPGAGEEKIKAEADKQLKMSGVVLSDQEIIQAMEAGAKGRFIPASLNKDGSLGRYSSALSRQELHTVLEYSKLLIAAMGRELLEGRVEPEPALTGRDSCRYCPYSPVCGRELGGQNVKQDKITPQEALAQMEEALQKGMNFTVFR